MLVLLSWTGLDITPASEPCARNNVKSRLQQCQKQLTTDHGVFPACNKGFSHTEVLQTTPLADVVSKRHTAGYAVAATT